MGFSGVVAGWPFLCSLGGQCFAAGLLFLCFLGVPWLSFCRAICHVCLDRPLWVFYAVAFDLCIAEVAVDVLGRACSFYVVVDLECLLFVFGFVRFAEFVSGYFLVGLVCAGWWSGLVEALSHHCSVE